MRTKTFLCVLLFTLSTSLHAYRVDVIQNDEIVPLGLLGGILKARGYEVEVFEASSLDVGALIARDADLLIILGGRQSVTTLNKHPYLYDEISLIRSRAQKNKPSLGLCLGAQLMALAFGGEVEKSPVAEQGWIELLPTEFSKESAAIQSLLDSNTQVYASHEDAIVSLPKEAKSLATSKLYNHVFSIGKALAIQFHPESTPLITKEWLMLFGASGDVTSKHSTNEIAFANNRCGIERFWNLYLDSQGASAAEKPH